MADILLCSMPFAALHVPVLGLELLKAGLVKSSYSARIRYFSLLFAEQISNLAYMRLANGTTETITETETCEWLFAADLFGSNSKEAGLFVDNVLRVHDPALHEFLLPEPEWFIDLALAAREQVAPFLDACLAEIEADLPRIIGFSCKFQQTLASLALARRVKQRWPEIFIVFGGAACDGIQGAELVRQFPCVDAVVSGWGDVVFPEIVRQVMQGRPVNELPGVFMQGKPLPLADGAALSCAPGPDDLDSLPYPDFTDYFAQVKSANLSGLKKPSLMLETARGCWWGDKVTCTFCGANAARSGHYQAKSPARAQAEIEHFIDLYPDTAITMVDNALCQDYFESVFPALARREKKCTDLFYEVRPTLTKEQMGVLKKAGVSEIQPGIESLNTGVLRQMQKGTTLLQNLQCLKWARTVGIKVRWNLLWGFPGEAPEAYAQMADLIPLITHLPPPQTFGQISIYRFSPLFDRAPQSGVTVRPSPVYHYIYPLPEEAVKNLATQFIYEYNPSRAVKDYTSGLADALGMWEQVHPHSRLECSDDGKRLLIHDQRPIAMAEYQEYTGLQRSLYLACDEAQPIPKLQKLAADETGQELSVELIEALLQPMMENKIIVQEGRRFLSLAIDEPILS